MRFSVKNIVLALAACSAIAGIQTATAGNGLPQPSAITTSKQLSSMNMRITGAISGNTCDVRPYTTAGADATVLNLGIYGVGQQSVLNKTTDVEFFLKADADCITTNAPKNGVEVRWSSSGLTTNGINNVYGTSDNVHIELSPVNGDGKTVAAIDTKKGVQEGSFVKEGNASVYYTGPVAPATVTPAAFKYKVAIVADTSGELLHQGTIDTDISYTVAYL